MEMPRNQENGCFDGDTTEIAHQTVIGDVFHLPVIEIANKSRIWDDFILRTIENARKSILRNVFNLAVEKINKDVIGIANISRV